MPELAPRRYKMVEKKRVACDSENSARLHVPRTARMYRKKLS
jgi:hypothetical protein